MSKNSQLIERILFENEYILWRGGPEYKKIFSYTDLYLVPFSIIWCAVVFTVSIVSYLEEGPIFLLLCEIPFLLSGIYFLFGRFVWQWYIRKRTDYCITNMRIIRNRNGKIDALEGDLISVTYVNFNWDGSGTINFGKSYVEDMKNYIPAPWNMNKEPFNIENVRNVNQVHQIIVNMKSKKEH